MDTHIYLQCVTGNTQADSGRDEAPLLHGSLDGSGTLGHQGSPFSEFLVIKVVRSAQNPNQVHSRIAQVGLNHSSLESKARQEGGPP